MALTFDLERQHVPVRAQFVLGADDILLLIVRAGRPDSQASSVAGLRVLARERTGSEIRKMGERGRATHHGLIFSIQVKTQKKHLSSPRHTGTTVT